MSQNIPIVKVNDLTVISEDIEAPPEGSPTIPAETASNADISLCEESFRPSYMIKVFCFHWLVSLLIVAAGINLSVYPLEILECSTYHVIVYLQLSFWVGTYMVNEFIKPACRKMAVRNRPLNEKMTIYRKKPLQIVSLWNTTLIVTQKVAMENFKITSIPTSKNCESVDGPPQLFIIVFSALQTVALTLFYVPALVYLVKAMGSDNLHARPSAIGDSDRHPDLLSNGSSAAAPAAFGPASTSTLERPSASSAGCIPVPKPLSEISFEEQAQLYSHWYKIAQIKNDKLWRRAQELSISEEHLPNSMGLMD